MIFWFPILIVIWFHVQYFFMQIKILFPESSMYLFFYFVPIFKLTSFISINSISFCAHTFSIQGFPSPLFFPHVLILILIYVNQTLFSRENLAIPNMAK